MRIPRIYQALSLSTGQELTLSTEASNHVGRVLRLSVGAKLRVFNGTGGEYNAEIIALNKQKTIVKLQEFITINTESTLTIQLGQAISRAEKMDFTIQKAVELGVTQITPLFTERCGVKLSEQRWQKRVEHWRAVAISACEQSGRDRVPTIIEPMILTTWLAQKSAGSCFILHPGGESRPALDTITTPITVLIGPEGGFSDNEVAIAQQQGFVSLNLGPRILRTETAALVAISAFQCWLGDFKM